VFLIRSVKQANSFTGLDLQLLLSGGGGGGLFKKRGKKREFRAFFAKNEEI
jgi:hypothetical protein